MQRFNAARSAERFLSITPPSTTPSISNAISGGDAAPADHRLLLLLRGGNARRRYRVAGHAATTRENPAQRDRVAEMRSSLALRPRCVKGSGR